MKTTNNKFKNQNYLAGFFGKPYGELLYSGTLAIETALISAGVKSGDYVLMPNNVCYRILLSISRLKAIPIIISPQNGYVLTELEVKEALKKYQIRVIILVHNIGLPVNVARIRKICGYNVKIIEDASQAWDIKSQNNPIGQFSDYVITSFGVSKPLSFGIGGAVFFSNQKLHLPIDKYDSLSRVSKQLLLPYALPNSIKLDPIKLVNIANKIVIHQRKIATFLLRNIKDPRLNLWKTLTGDNPTWHRFPIWTDNFNLFRNLQKLADINHVKYELPYKTTLDKIPLAARLNSIHMDYSGIKYYHILIKTRQNSLINIRKWTKAINPKNLKK